MVRNVSQCRDKEKSVLNLLSELQIVKNVEVNYISAKVLRKFGAFRDYFVLKKITVRSNSV